MSRQLTFDFVPEMERLEHIAQQRWTHISPGQEVITTHIVVWFEKEYTEWSDEQEDVRYGKEVKQRWHVYLLPVLVNECGCGQLFFVQRILQGQSWQEATKE